MEESRAAKQDIRPMRIAILNLMPNKIQTETQLARLLGNTSLQVELTLLRTGTYQSKNANKEHLASFYKTWDEVKDEKFDGFIVTGAPLGQVDFETVDYWPELTGIMDWAQTHAFRSFYICWGALAGLYHYHGIEKSVRSQKLSGVFRYARTDHHTYLFRGLNDEFWMPTSRFGEVTRSQIEACEGLQVLSDSNVAGVGFVRDLKTRNCYMLNHPEYDTETLKDEYIRDKRQPDNVLPLNYFPDDDPSKEPKNLWRANAHLLFANWLDEIYQGTPYDLADL